MKRFLGIGFLVLVSAAGWKVGEHMSTDALGMALGVIFGMMAGIPAALIALSASRNVRHDHYHHRDNETPQKPRKQPQRAIAARPTSYIVVGESEQLQSAQQPRIEVRR